MYTFYLLVALEETFRQSVAENQQLSVCIIRSSWADESIIVIISLD